MSLNEYPRLQFTIIINPNSGPGSAPWWPNEDYVREIPRLNAFSNVRTVGYVRTAYCRRPIQEVFEDIEKYEKWPCESPLNGLFVDGIFFDETPNVYSKEAYDYLREITSRTKNDEDGIGKNPKLVSSHSIIRSCTMTDSSELGYPQSWYCG